MWIGSSKTLVTLQKVLNQWKLNCNFCPTLFAATLELSVDVECESPACLHTMPYFPKGTDSAVPQQQTRTVDCFRCRPIFSFFFTGISKQTELELAVRRLREAGRAAVSSHDPSLTQRDWGPWGRLQGGLQSGEIRGRNKKVEGSALKVILWYGGAFALWREKRCRNQSDLSPQGVITTSRFGH